MADRYMPLARDARVFRLARREGGHLPSGQRLPKPEWLEPTRDDKTAAEASGRVPGLSVWDVAFTSYADAVWLRDSTASGQEAFVAEVATLVTIANTHTRSLDVVSDPLDVPFADPRWAHLDDARRQSLANAVNGHALIEGISRPDGVQRSPHRSFLTDLVEAFAPHAA